MEFNDGGNNNNNINNEDESVTRKLKILTTFLIILAICRLFIFDLFSMISDIITAFILYFTYITKNNFMAIFCILNGIIGVLFNLAKMLTDLEKLNKHTGFFRFMFFFVFVSAIIIYLLITYYSYRAMKVYRPQNPQMYGGGYQPQNYGALNNNNDTNPNNNNGGRYAAFSGRGQSVGGV
jgi:hypothetical protein